MMGHGSHHNCMMCKMAKTVGMMEKHPENCDCQNQKEEKEEKHEEKS